MDVNKHKGESRVTTRVWNLKDFEALNEAKLLKMFGHLGTQKTQNFKPWWVELRKEAYALIIKIERGKTSQRCSGSHLAEIICEVNNKQSY